MSSTRQSLMIFFFLSLVFNNVHAEFKCSPYKGNDEFYKSGWCNEYIPNCDKAGVVGGCSFSEIERTWMIQKELMLEYLYDNNKKKCSTSKMNNYEELCFEFMPACLMSGSSCPDDTILQAYKEQSVFERETLEKILVLDVTLSLDGNTGKGKLTNKNVNLYSVNSKKAKLVHGMMEVARLKIDKFEKTTIDRQEAYSQKESAFRNILVTQGNLMLNLSDDEKQQMTSGQDQLFNTDRVKKEMKINNDLFDKELETNSAVQDTKINFGKITRDFLESVYVRNTEYSKDVFVSENTSEVLNEHNKKLDEMYAKTTEINKRLDKIVGVPIKHGLKTKIRKADDIKDYSDGTVVIMTPRSFVGGKYYKILTGQEHRACKLFGYGEVILNLTDNGYSGYTDNLAMLKEDGSFDRIVDQNNYYIQKLTCKNGVQKLRTDVTQFS